MLGIIAIACVGAVVLSGGAVAVGFFSFRASPKPRPFGRYLELLGLAIPAVICGLFLGFLLGPWS